MAAEEDATQVNALQDNIQRKGQNAYYYAHAASRETVKNYGGEPQRVAVGPADNAAVAGKRKVRITKYSWADGKKTVKIYVPTEFCGEHALGEVAVDWSESSVALTVAGVGGKDYELRFPKLHDEISKATHKCKEDSIVLTLFKATEISWYELVRK